MLKGMPRTLYHAMLNGMIPRVPNGALLAKKDSIYIPSQPSILMERFESGNGYAKGSSGTLTNDTTDFVTGTQSVKMTTDGAGTVMQLTKTYGSPINLTGSYLLIRAKIDSFAKLGEFTLYIANEAGFVNWSILDLGAVGDGQSFHYLEDGIWQNIIVDLGMLQVGGGTFNPAALTTIRVRAKDKGGAAPVNVWIDEVSAIARLPKGIVVITADDGWAVQDTAMRPVLDKFGFRPTLYIIPDAVGTPNYLTLSAIKRLQHINRWEMGLHHQTNLVTLKAQYGAAFVETTMQKGLEYGLLNGFNGIHHFALPNGAFDQTILDIMKRYFKTSRGIIYGSNSSFPYLEQCPMGDLYKIRCFDVRSSHSTATIQSLFDRVELQHSVGIFNFHKIVSSLTGDVIEYLDTNFTTIINYLATKNVLVLTMGELYNYMVQNIG